MHQLTLAAAISLTAMCALACPPQGDATNANAKTLNVLKNRSVAPVTIDRHVTLNAMLAKGDDTNRFDQSHAATITGYVWAVEEGGVESCNCHARLPNDRDTHIYVSLDEKHSKGTQSVIVEVTPRFRAQHPGWITKSLNKQLQGKTVTFTGWLFFDSEHKQNAVNTRPVGTNLWRGTVWEIHPVTSISVKAVM